MMGEVRSCKEQQWELVLCLECRKELTKGSIVTHCQTQLGLTKGRLGSKGDESDGGGDEPRTYKMVFLTRAGPRPCPVEGCSGRASTRMAIRVHFWHWYVRNIVAILLEGNLPHP